jgi:hypothetical protein
LRRVPAKNNAGLDRFLASFKALLSGRFSPEFVKRVDRYFTMVTETLHVYFVLDTRGPRDETEVTDCYDVRAGNLMAAVLVVEHKNNKRQLACIQLIS